ncbi:MAG: hypothetical protein EXQ69_03290 [Acidimicrobiia bacterium]|nr:hypothetical protein [Acidimicrobiia bacterium]
MDTDSGREYSVEALSIDFSIEELVVMAEILELRGIPGLGQEPLAFLAPDLHEAVLASARRSLVARRFVRPTDDEGFEIMRPVAQMVASVARAGIQIRAVFEADGLVETRCFAAEPDLAIEHSVVFGAVQRLTPFRTEQLLARVLEFSGIEARPQSAVAPLTTSERALTACVEMLAAGDRGAAELVLTTDGVPEPSAAAFVAAIEHRVSSASVSILHRPKAEEIHGGELTWIDCGEHGLWLTPPLSEVAETADGEALEPVLVTIEPTTAKWIAEELLSYLPGAL